MCTCVCAHVCVHVSETYSGFPAEDVAVEAEPALRQVQTPLEQDVLLQSAGVVWSRHSSSADRPQACHRGHATHTRVSLTHDEPLGVGELLEYFAEILVSLFVGGAENLQTRTERKPSPGRSSAGSRVFREGGSVGVNLRCTSSAFSARERQRFRKGFSPAAVPPQSQP